MRIAVLGTGSVGMTLAEALDRLGHEVTMGTRDVEATLARPAGGSTFAGWSSAHPGITLSSFAAAAGIGEMIVNATNGAWALPALEAAGGARLAGKILVDVSNPLDFSGGGPALSVANTDSLGETIQRTFPDAMVVKALNTVNASLMVDPSLAAGGDHTVFVCGDDEASKSVVSELLASLGWVDIVDLGGIAAARGTEMYLMLWLSLHARFGELATIRVVR